MELFLRYKWRILLVTFGIIFAILIFTLGFWRTLLLTVIVSLCYFFGLLLDEGGRAKVNAFFEELFKKK